MKIQFQALTCVVGFILCLQPGCSTGLSAVEAARGHGFRNHTRLIRMDPNNLPFSVEIMERADGSVDFFWKAEGRIKQKQTCGAKYHRLYYASRFAVVEGSVGEHRRKYPIVLDTGASQPIFVKVSHILDNKLPVYPLQNDKAGLNGHGLGLCWLAELQIADVTLADWPCLYLEQPAKSRFFGLSVAGSSSEDNTVIIGLPVLREFKYLMFDNVGEQVVFSSDESFQASEPNLGKNFLFR